MLKSIALRICARFVGLTTLVVLLPGSALAQASKESAADSKPTTSSAPPLELSPFVVSGDKRPWLYGSLPGFEILTRTSEKRTRYLVLCYLRTWMIENAIIPEGWLRESPVPYSIIVDDTEPGTAGQLPGAPALTKEEDYDLFGWTLKEYNPLFNPLTPLNGWIHAADEDATVLGANLYGDPFMLRAPVRLDRISRTVPSLPRWVEAGLVGRYGLFEDTNLFLMVIHSSDPSTAPPSAAIFRGIRWISSAESKRLARPFVPDREIPFIPLQEFFSESPQPLEQMALWESQAGLLLRWGLLGTRGRLNPERRAQFVKFVERLRSEPVTEKMVIECFGHGYAAMERDLKEYLKKTLGKEIQVNMQVPNGFQPIAFGPATPEQVGRITGDWFRMHGESLRNSQPAMAKAFFDSADRALSRAWLRYSQWLPSPGEIAGAEKKNLAAIIGASKITSAGHPDPDFLAVCGLHEYTIGEPKLARDLLEIAVSLRTRRPKAHLLLAELRAREVTAAPSGRNGAVSTAQANYVLQALKAALPPASSARPWQLMVDILARCENTPSNENLDMIIKGTARFPRDSTLQLEVARLCLKSGGKERALEVIDQALLLVIEERARNSLQELRASIREDKSG